MRIRSLIAAAASMAVAGCQSAEVAAPPLPSPICNALAMYANGIVSGGCSQLGDPGQPNWVCELPGAPPNFDVHTTFGQTTALHLTVRSTAPGGCSGNTGLTGAWPQLGLANGAPICTVPLGPFLSNINAFPNRYGAKAGFVQAQTLGILTAKETSAWLKRVTQFRCT